MGLSSPRTTDPPKDGVFQESGAAPESAETFAVAVPMRRRRRNLQPAETFSLQDPTRPLRDPLPWNRMVAAVFVLKRRNDVVRQPEVSDRIRVKLAATNERRDPDTRVFNR